MNLCLFFSFGSKPDGWRLIRISAASFGSNIPQFGRTQYRFGTVVLILNIIVLSVGFVRTIEVVTVVWKGPVNRYNQFVSQSQFTFTLSLLKQINGSLTYLKNKAKTFPLFFSTINFIRQTKVKVHGQNIEWRTKKKMNAKWKANQPSTTVIKLHHYRKFIIERKEKRNKKKTHRYSFLFHEIRHY
jgi:hypothetical protein